VTYPQQQPGQYPVAPQFAQPAPHHDMPVPTHKVGRNAFTWMWICITVGMLTCCCVMPASWVLPLYLNLHTNGDPGPGEYSIAGLASIGIAILSAASWVGAIVSFMAWRQDKAATTPQGV
jgi:hypothetical protein